MGSGDGQRDADSSAREQTASGGDDSTRDDTDTNPLEDSTTNPLDDLTPNSPDDESIPDNSLDDDSIPDTSEASRLEDGSADADSETNHPDDPKTESSGDAETESLTPKIPEFTDYYELLGVSEDASQAEIMRAYREMAKRTHPDASNLSEEAAEAQFRRVLTARDVLTSEETRRAYDTLGHDEFCRQSDALGEHVSKPTTVDDDPGVGPGRAQRSARGEAARRGDPLVPPVDSVLFDPPPEPNDIGDTEPKSRGRGIYQFVFDAEGFESTSLDTVAWRWRAAWRVRIVAAVVLPTVISLLIFGLSALPAGTGVTVSTPRITPARFALLVFVAFVGMTAYTGLVTERALPRGAFVADRAVGRFAAERSRRYRRRGALLLGVVFALIATTANAGADPWTHTAETVRGNGTGFPWFEPGTAGLSESALLDGALTVVFIIASLAGVSLFVLGMSATLWRARYERGSRIRPSLWEPLLVPALICTPIALLGGALEIATVSGLESFPSTVQTALVLENGSLTVATLAVSATVLSVLLWPLSHLRLGLLR